MALRNDLAQPALRTLTWLPVSPKSAPDYLADLSAEDAIAIYRYLTAVADQQVVERHAEATRTAALEFLVMAREMRRQPRAASRQACA